MFVSVASASTGAQPYQIAEKFCNAEISGDSSAREQLLDPSRALRLEIAKSKEPMKATAIDYSSEPLIVIKSCKVEKTVIGEGVATVTISTHRLAIARGEGGSPDDRPRRFVKDVNPDDKTELSMVNTDGEWRIVYPPFPRVGIESLINLIESDVAGLEKIYLDGGKKTFQKVSLDYQKSELAFLKSLADKK